MMTSSTGFLRFFSILSCGYTLQIDALHLFIYSLKRPHTNVCPWVGPALASLLPDKTKLFLSPGDEQMNFGKLEKLPWKLLVKALLITAQYSKTK